MNKFSYDILNYLYSQIFPPTTKLSAKSLTEQKTTYEFCFVSRCKSVLNCSA